MRAATAIADFAPAKFAEPGRDVMLMQQVASGDLAAFEELVARHQDRAWSFAWRMLGDSAEAQDIVQDAFLRVFRAASRYRATAAFRTYLFQIIARLCFDVRSRKRPELRDEFIDVAASTATPEELLSQREHSVAVRRAIAKLPARHRAAILLRHEEGMSYDEIGAILGVSAKAVDSLLQRARQSLRALLTDLR